MRAQAALRVTFCAALLVAAAPLVDAADPASTQQHGHEVFAHWCAPCHAPVSGDEHLPGTSTLQALYHGTKPAALEQRHDLTPALVEFYVRHGDNAMPWFRRTEISDADLMALAAYLSRNNAGIVPQASNR